MAALDFPASPTVGQTTADGRFRWNGVGWVRVKTPTVLPISQGGTGASTASGARDNLGLREKLSAPRTYYVRTDGSDSNTGLANSSAGAFRTIQAAVDVVGTLDTGISNVTISVGAGTFGYFITKDPAGAGSVFVVGAGMAATTIAASFSGSCVSAPSGSSKYTVSDMLVTNTGPAYAAHGVAAEIGARLVCNNIDFGPCGGFHVSSLGLVVVGAHRISGAAIIHWYASDTGRLISANTTVTIVGTPNFPLGFAYADCLALVRVNDNTFTGGATGPRYSTNRNSVIFVNAAGESYLPGNAPGTRNGGLYE